MLQRVFMPWGSSEDRNTVVKMTTSKDKPDVISLEDGISPERAVMPCGHAISAESMVLLSLNVLKNNHSVICCPECKKNWTWNLVKQVIDSSENWKKIESKIEQVMLSNSKCYRQCPGCDMWLKKTGDSIEVVNCLHCTEEKNKNFNFCWYCLHSTSELTNKCPDQCRSQIGYEDVIRNCPLIEIDSRKCYSIRKCPNCTINIRHNNGCKHMICSYCKCHFCFFCLEFSLPGQGQFDPHFGWKCKLAPRQLLN